MTSIMNRTARLLRGLVAGAMMTAVLTGLPPSTGAAEPGALPPAPKADLPQAADGALHSVVLAGGCFWGVQAVYQHVKGVEAAVSGYAGGEASTARYEWVTTGRTGHAEAVKVTYDPKIISYGQILRIFFSVVHDPTQLNRQGPDIGTQYRSAIFTSDEAEREVAKSYIAQLDEAKAYKKTIATRLEPLAAFYPAESYHQDYLVRHPTQPYILFHDMPKLDALKRLFPDAYRSEPRLVAPWRRPS